MWMGKWDGNAKSERVLKCFSFRQFRLVLAAGTTSGIYFGKKNRYNKKDGEKHHAAKDDFKKTSIPKEDAKKGHIAKDDAKKTHVPKADWSMASLSILLKFLSKISMGFHCCFVLFGICCWP